MSHSPRKSLKLAFASLLGIVLVATPLVAIPAQANPAGNGVVINELYLNGGSSGATYKYRFVELYNPTTADVPLTGTSLQYRARTSTGDPTMVVALTGVIPAHGTYLVGGASNGSNGADLPTPDQGDTPFNFAAAGGLVILANQTSALNPGTGNVAGAAGVIDLVGYGSGNTYETTAAPAASTTTSINRTNGVDTDNNAADFTAGAPTPTPSGYVPPAPVDLGFKTIAEIQGTGDASPFVGDDTLTTKGIVTAVYKTGGFNGFYIQTPGTGGAVNMVTHTASDGLFVYSGNTGTVDTVAVGKYVEVAGSISEYYGLTQIVPTNAASVTVLTDVVAPVAAAKVSWQTSETARETLEGMLVAPQGSFTVSDTYSANQYGEILLASGSSPLLQPTEVAAPGVAAYAAALAANNNISVTLDDGATTNFLSSANQSIPLPYISNDKPVRVGESVTFTSPILFDFRNGKWKFQPTQQLTVANAATVQPVTFNNTRQATPMDVGGDLKLATFNVLNYFTTLGADVAGCTAYNDRAGNPITVRSCSVANGPRGAWDAANLKRQQDKIVAAITALNADVIGLEEIEASTSVSGGGSDRDAALKSLVAALNAKAGSAVWSAVLSPAALPANEDVIRTAFIYKNATAEPVGNSTILIGSAAFDNAREPLAQAFKAKGAPDANKFLAIVNHFKSKGSGSGADADMNDGQGASNASRVAQATALVDFANTMSTSANTNRVFLMGDFNSYTKEDPMNVLFAAGYIDQGSKTGKYTYSFGGAVGSLDHVLASPAADTAVNLVDIWNVNSPESVALEYSRYNSNATDFYRADMYRASDHDPLIVGLDLTPGTVHLNLLNINDFHGRIDGNTVKFAGTIEQLRAQYGDAKTLLGSAGDNIGASLFASSSQRDKPTIDVLNALKLQSSVGNHEFDKGYADLTGEIASWTSWSYLGANVYFKGTLNPALPEYVIVDIQGVKVGIIGAVTAETPSLVTKSGISMLDFGDPVTAVNRVATQLSDGDLTNGEADVIVAEYHEGAGLGTAGGGTLANQVAAGGAFAEIVNDTSSKVDVIFTGHTHQAYAWDALIPGSSTKTRPVLQTGSYGANIGQVVLTVNSATGDVTGYTARNVPRTTVADSTLVATYPRVATVKGIVDAALAQAAIIGNVQVGSVTADISRAFTAGTEDRGSESTIGNLVANSLVASLGSADRGGAEIGIVNPGGLRADLLKDGDGVITYAEANAVLPFLNNLWTTTLTGAQFKTVLEQQWQRDKDGVPFTSGRTFLNLGLSDNVTYTYDATRPMDDRVTAIFIDGQPIDMARDYRIGSFSFLLQAGDNFWEFANATDTRDSGLVDSDAWIAFITANSPLSPSFARHAAQVTDVTAGPVAPGDTVSLNVSKLDLTSLGSPANTELTLTWEGSSAVLGTVPVTAGAAAVSFTVPADANGSGTLVMTAAPSGTVVRVPFEVSAPVVFTTSTDLKLNRFFGFSWQTTKATVTVTTDADAAPTGSVKITVNGITVSTAPITASDHGKVSVTLPKLGGGIYFVRAEFVPADVTTMTGSTSNYKFLFILF